MSDDNQALLLQVSADLRALERNVQNGRKTFNTELDNIERRASSFSKKLEETFGEANFGKAFEKVFDSSRFKIFEEGGAQLRVFGSALEPLGGLGIAAAAGLAATAIAIESVKKAAEDVGQLQISSEKLGIPVEELQRWQFIAAASHVSNQELASSFSGLAATLGKLKSGIRDARVKPFLDELGLSEADIAKIPNAAAMMELLIQRMNQLKVDPNERIQIAEAFGGEGAINILMKTTGAIDEMSDAWRKNASVVSGEQASAVEESNQKLEESHAILQTKIRADLVELAPLVSGLGLAWDSIAESVLGAIAWMAKGLAKFKETADAMANYKAAPDSGPQGKMDQFNKNWIGGVNVALSHPMDTLSSIMGGRLWELGSPSGPGAADRAMDRMLGGSSPSAAAAEHHPAADTANPAPGRTGAQLKAEGEAKDKLDEIEARLLNHTTHRLEAEKQIAEINKQRAAAGDKPLDKATTDKLLNAASAEDAKAGNRSASEAARKAAELAKKNLERREATQQIEDEATDKELAARKALAVNVEDQASIEATMLEAVRKKAVDKINADIKEGKVDAAGGARAIGLVNQAASETAQKNARDLHDKLAEQAVQLQSQDIESQISLLQAQGQLLITAEARRTNELRILDLQQELTRIQLEQIKSAEGVSLADKALAQAKLDALPKQKAADIANINHSTQGPIGQFQDQLQTSLADPGQKLAVAGIQEVGSGLEAVMEKSKTAKAALHDMVTSFIADLIRLGIEKEELALINGIFGGPAAAGSTTGAGSSGAGGSGLLGWAAAGIGHLLGFADGGKIKGQGGPTDDKNLAMLSDGERVMNARAERSYGPLLDAMNKGKLPRFASGGGMSTGLLRSLGNLSAAPTHAAGGSTHLHFDLSGAVMTEDLVKQMQGYADGTALRHAQGAVGVSVAANRQDAYNRARRSLAGR